MHVHWQTFEQDGQTVEAQVFHPDAPSQKLVLFCPGFPGLGAGMFEQRHAAELVEHGFDVVVIKHAGTRLDNPLTPSAVNNAARLAQGRKNKETHLGGGPSTLVKWLREPAIALQTLHVNYADIVVIGNSFGAVSALWSLTIGGAPTANIRTLLLMAGAQGLDNGPTGIMSIWQPTALSNPFIASVVTLDSPQSIHDTLKNAYADIADKAASLPDHIVLKYLCVTADEILPRRFTDDFRAHLNNRGEIIMDDIDQAHPECAMRAHDTPDYPTDKLLELLNG
ncbi:MAG TPA: hypothetical protein VIN59_07255 [Alphaproteobacteria bacterium]